MLQKNQLLQHERFRIIRQLSQSPNGLSYEAFDNTLKINVSLREISAKRNKILTSAQIAAQKNVIAEEVKVLTAIKHDSILRVYDYFLEADHHYLVTEFAEGNNLSELLRKGLASFAIPNILGWSDDLLKAISYLHTQPEALVHGNIKPENIILTANGKIKLLPFGISQTSNPKKDSLITEQEFDAANLHYSPLEQIWKGLDPASRKAILNDYEESSARILEKPFDAQTDIYALGATLYHLLTKCLPIDPLERSIDMLEGKKDPLKAAAKIDSIIPAAVSEALSKAMQIKRENRFDSALSMQKVLNGVLAQFQTRESLKTSKFKDDEDLLEISVVERKTPKTPETKINPKNAEVEAEQNRQFELIKKQLQNAEEQRLKAEQRAVEAEKLLLEKETKIAIPPPETQPEESVKEEIIEIPAKIENIQSSQPAAEFFTESQAIDADAKSPVSTVNSPAPTSLLFSEPPKENKIFRRMGIAVFLFALLGGAGWGISNFTKSKEITPTQAISSGETATPPAETEKSSAAPTDSPVTPTESANIQPVSEKEVVPADAEVKPQTETAVSSQSARNKTAAPLPQQRLPKQSPTPPKIAANEKKPVTVDDIINDN